MELTQVTRRVSSGPIVLVMAFLAVLALGLTGWYVASSPSTSHPATTATTGFPGPDAVERNQQLQDQHDANAHHGH